MSYRYPPYWPFSYIPSSISIILLTIVSYNSTVEFAGPTTESPYRPFGDQAADTTLGQMDIDL